MCRRARAPSSPAWAPTRRASPPRSRRGVLQRLRVPGFDVAYLVCSDDPDRINDTRAQPAPPARCSSASRTPSRRAASSPPPCSILAGPDALAVAGTFDEEMFALVRRRTTRWPRPPRSPGASERFGQAPTRECRGALRAPRPGQVLVPVVISPGEPEAIARAEEEWGRHGQARVAPEDVGRVPQPGLMRGRRGPAALKAGGRLLSIRASPPQPLQRRRGAADRQPRASTRAQMMRIRCALRAVRVSNLAEAGAGHVRRVRAGGGPHEPRQACIDRARTRVRPERIQPTPAK